MLNTSDMSATTQKLLNALVEFRRLNSGFEKAGHTHHAEDSHGNICEIRHGEIMLMFMLCETQSKFENGISVSELSSILQVKSPTITPQLNSLEKKGLITRFMDPNDRRIVRVKLNPSGKNFIMHKQNEFSKRLEGLVQYLGEQKSNQLADLMMEVYDYMKISKPKA